MKLDSIEWMHDYKISSDIINKFNSNPITKPGIDRFLLEIHRTRLEFITLLKLHYKYCHGPLQLRVTYDLIDIFEAIRVSEIIEHVSETKNNN